MQLQELTLELWDWCNQRDLFVIAHHLPGKLNIQADLESRHAVSGQQRLDDRSQNYKTVPEELSDGSLRLSSNTTTNKLHQLETRPRGSSLGCLHDALKGTCGICFPSLQLGPHGPQKKSCRTRQGSSSSALVASARVFWYNNLSMDVHTVTAYFKQMRDNATLKLKQLSLKLATLFALTCPKGVSSLSQIWTLITTNYPMQKA